MKWAAIIALVFAALGTNSAHAALPGRDGRIAFTSDYFPDDCGMHSCESEVSRLNTMRPDGTDRRPIGPCHGEWNEGCGDREAAWSPDGRRIAFVQDDGIWVMRANGSHAHRVFGKSADAPSWSPDGRHIVFTELHDFVGWISIMRINGTHRRRLTRSHRNADPSWSRGGLIAYSHFPVDFQPTTIVTIRLDGHRVGRIENKFSLENPDFSPDGKLVAFDMYNHDDNLSVWVARPDGSHMRRVVKDGLAPAWSPSGRFIAYSSPSQPTGLSDRDIFIARRDGSHAHRVGPSPRRSTERPGDYIEPSWQPLPF